MNQNIGTELIQFIKESPSAFHAVATMKKEFLNHGFTQLQENERWNLSPVAATLLPVMIPPSLLSLFRKTALTACASWQATATLLPLKSRKIQRWK